MFSLFKKKELPKLKICPDCNATGCHDQVYRGFNGWPMEYVCKPCMGRGHRILEEGEVAGEMRVSIGAIG